MKPAATVPAYQHVRELRGRILWCIAWLALGATAGYVFRTTLISILDRPLGQDLFYTSPTGSFEFIMRLCFLVGFLAALPAIVYHILRFIEPALSRALSHRLIIGVVTASFALMIAGVSFGYFVSLPAALHFFKQVGTSDLKALITADQYFSFVVNYLAVFAAVFQLPLILLFVNRITPLGPGKLGRYRKFVIVGSFIVALITPSAPDPLSQVILAVPIIVLYEASIWIIWVVNRSRRQPLPVHAVTSHLAPTPARPSAPVVPRPAAASARYRQPLQRGVRTPATIDLRGIELTAPRPARNVLDLRPQAAQ